MDVFIVWETWLKPEHADRGYEITEVIWRDMLDFKGYIGHFLLRDGDNSAHLLLVSHWATRQDADDAKKEYRSPNLTELEPLLLKERGRTVYNLEEVNMAHGFEPAVHI